MAKICTADGPLTAFSNISACQPIPWGKTMVSYRASWVGKMLSLFVGFVVQIAERFHHADGPRPRL
jgi:hypothetical protein